MIDIDGILPSCAQGEPFGASHPPRFDRHQGPKVGQPIVSLVNSPIDDRKSTGKWFFSPRNQWSEMGPYLGHEVSGPIFVSTKKTTGGSETPRGPWNRYP